MKKFYVHLFLAHARGCPTKIHSSSRTWGCFITLATGQNNCFWSLDGRTCVDLEAKFCIDLRSCAFCFIFTIKLSLIYLHNKCHYIRKIEGFLFSSLFLVLLL